LIRFILKTNEIQPEIKAALRHLLTKKGETAAAPVAGAPQ